jgi:hypothetical protein
VALAVECGEDKLSKAKADECENMTEKQKADSYTACSAARDACERAAAKAGTSSNGGSSGNNAGSNRCDALQDKAKEAARKYRQACADAGLAQDCDAQVGKCDKAMSGQEATSQSVLLDSLATVAGVATSSQRLNKCSSLTGREFADQKEKLKRELDDINRDLKKNADDKVQAEQEYNDAVEKMDAEVAKQQQEFQEAQNKLPAAAREAQRNVDQQVAQAKANRRALEAKMVSLNSNQTTLLRNKAQQLAQLVESNATISCYDKAKTMLMSGSKKGTNNFSQLTSDAGQAVVMAQTVYKSCLADFAAKRLEVIQNSAAALAANQKDIENTQSEIDNIDQQVASAIEEQNQNKIDTAKNTALAQAGMAKTIELANKKRKTLDDNKAARAKVLADEENLLKSKFRDASNEMLLLGGAPAKTSGDGSVQKAYEAYQNKEEAESDWKAYKVPGAKLEDKDGESCPGVKDAEKKSSSAKTSRDRGTAR